FIFDRGRGRLIGYCLSAGEAGSYQPIVPQAGRWTSRVLGLELALEGERFRFYYGTAPLPDAQELMDHAQELVQEVIAKKEEAERRAFEAEERLATVLRELEKLRKDQ